MPLDLIADHAALVAAIRKQIKGDVVCVFIDTLNRSLRGSESSDEDTAEYIRAGDAIRDVLRCSIIIVHHCGYNDSRMRGHSSLIGALDAELSVKKDGDGLFTVKVERAKDDKEGETIACKLVSVDLGLDNEGDPITSCVVVAAADSDGTPRAAPTRKLSHRQKLAVDALKALVGSQGEALPIAFGLPASIAAVAVTAWRDDLYRRGSLDSTAKNPRADFLRLKDSLKARQIIAERDGRRRSQSHGSRRRPCELERRP